MVKIKKGTIAHAALRLLQDNCGLSLLGWHALHGHYALPQQFERRVVLLLLDARCIAQVGKSHYATTAVGALALGLPASSAQVTCEPNSVAIIAAVNQVPQHAMLRAQALVSSEGQALAYWPTWSQRWPIHHFTWRASALIIHHPPTREGACIGRQAGPVFPFPSRVSALGLALSPSGRAAGSAAGGLA